MTRRITHSLDTLGNWSSQTVDGTETSRTHNSKNQVTVVGSADLTFDSNGNTLTDDKGTVYTYDAWNRQMTATPVGTNHEEYYTYDALNRRVTDLDGTISTTPVLVINDGSPQRSMIESLTMVFPQPVTLSSGAITLAGRTVGSITLSITNPSSDGKTYLITFSNSSQLFSGAVSLNDDIYDLTLTASDISGAGAPGSNQTYTFYNLYGDYFGNGAVEYSDLLALVADFGATAGESDYVWFMDHDNSGTIGYGDLTSVITDFGDSYSFTPSGAILQGASATEVLTYTPITLATGESNSGKVLEGVAPRDLYYSRNWQVLEERGQNPNTTTAETDVQYVWSAAYVDCLVLRDRDTDGNSATGNYGISGSGLDERLYAQQDANWNTTALVDTSGDVQEYFVYDPYGNATVMDSSGDPTLDNYHWLYLHQGGRLDTITGLYHFDHRDYGPGLGRWYEQERFGGQYVDGMNLYEDEASRPTVVLDPSGDSFHIQVHDEPLSQIQQIPGADAGTLAWTETQAQPTYRNEDDIEKVGTCCAKVKAAKDIDLTAVSYVPSDGVGTVFTHRRLVDIRDHEERRRHAMRDGYNTYLSPVSGSSSGATSCGTICRGTADEAKQVLQQYLNDLRSAALEQYNEYNMAQQIAIGGENNHWRPDVFENGRSLLDGYDPDFVHNPDQPPAFNPPPCPSAK